MGNGIGLECVENSESMLDVSVISLSGRVTNARNYSCSDVTPLITDVTTPDISFRDESSTFRENSSLYGLNSSNYKHPKT